ncbi:N-formylglutamate amidohydrolase [Telmatospirillum sp. J64-1]|uniref:N-formylglutamate amidohydrolase n=1 Tax=Telmatospirillum sp. J64-1 TaxID=2502183 RepID=UPI00115CAE20|nr:N-formylglutamate amidohydrolase [Telmatospirillum sp. J64-1]
MDSIPNKGWQAPEGQGEVFDITEPSRQTVPLVFASPHSGRNYPADFVAASALDPQTLRKSEDSFVDELFAAAPEFGAPIIRALFPRAYLDLNREPYELDPAMFADRLPPHANVRSPRVAIGLGTIARLVASGAEIYSRKLTFAEAEQRIARFYRPYHDALAGLIERTRAQFGYCLLIDCHSMPSTPGSTERGSGQVDFVLGDVFGTSAAPSLCATVESVLKGQGYRVVRNTPYAGGFTTYHYGQPSRGVHALQIEINRHLYMVEETHERSQGFTRLANHLRAVIAALTTLPASDFVPR